MVIRALGLALLVAILLTTVAAGVEPEVPFLDSGADATLARMVSDELTGAGLATFGVAIRHLPTGRSAYLNADLVEPASLFKLPVLYEAYRQLKSGRLTLEEMLTLSDLHLERSREFGESAVPAGQPITVDGALDLIITLSETALALALLDRMGYAELNPGLRAVGLTQTAIDHGSTVTARDMLRFFEALARLEAVDVAASRGMLHRLLRQQVNDRIPHRLPPTTLVAHKTGNLPGLMHDVGLVYTAAGPVVVVLLADVVTNDDAVREGMARLAQAVDGYARVGGFGEPTNWPLLWDPELEARVRSITAAVPDLELVVAHLGTGQLLIERDDHGSAAATIVRLRALLAGAPRDASSLVPSDSILADIPPSDRRSYLTEPVGRSHREVAIVHVASGEYLLAAQTEHAEAVNLPLLGAAIHRYFEQCAWGHRGPNSPCAS